ncbi:hypothetical protein [Caballeronia sp. S22]|uniref:hypothetical protein n=1 Tax=Caballeronia sp. S22 TaxID=3137182 RepID=UPI0035305BCC
MDGWHNASLILLRFFALCMRLPSLHCTYEQCPASANTALGNGILLVSEAIGRGNGLLEIMRDSHGCSLEVRDTRSKKKPTFNERRFSEGRCEPQRLDHSIRIKPPASMAIRQRM